MADRKRRWLWGTLALVVLAPAAIYGLTLLPGGAAPTGNHPTAPVSPTPSVNVVPTLTIDGFVVPETYWQACTYEAGVCDPNDPSLPSPRARLPAALWRPLQLPVVQPGQPCPTTAGRPYSTSAFGGQALGPGPVRLLSPNPVGISSVSSPSGWYSLDATTLWFSEPTYQGPWLLRGVGLDTDSNVLFGNPPTLTASLVVPPIDTLNTYSGYRTALEGMLVRGPGCYGVQVDGLSFSYDIVFEATLAWDGSTRLQAAPASPAPRAPSQSPCSQSSFQLSLAKDTGGQASPIAAAEWFAMHAGVWTGVPTTGWRVVSAQASATSVQSGSILLQTVQGSDGTWQVASGTDLSCSTSSGAS